MRGLERLLGFAIRRDSSLTGDIQKLLSLQQCGEEEGKPAGRETMLESWKGSILAKDVELLLPALKRGETRDWQSLFASSSDSVSDSHEMFSFEVCGTPRQNALQDHTISSPPEIELHQLDYQQSQPVDVFAVVQDPIVKARVLDSNRRTGTAPAGPPFQPSDVLPVNAKQMIDEYLTYTNCWIPILEPHELFRTLHQCRISDSARYLEGRETGQVAVLWAVFAFESCKGSESGGSESSKPQQNSTYNTSRRLIPIEDEEHNFGHIQALLILVMINIGHGCWKSAWLLLGYARRLLDYQPAGHEGKDLESSMDQGYNSRKTHVLLGTSLLETLLVWRLGNGVAIQTQFRHHSLREDGLEEWETPRFPNLLPDSSYKLGADLPGRVLSSFNGFCGTVGNLNDLLIPTDQGIWSNSEYEKFLGTLRTETPELYQNYIRSHYPQYLIRYLTNQCCILELSYQRVKEKHRPPMTSEEITSYHSLLAPILDVLEQFQSIHGVSRVPVVLATIMHPAIEDVISLFKVSQPRDKSSLATIFRDLSQLLRGVGKYWPAFTDSAELLLSSIGLNPENVTTTVDTNIQPVVCPDVNRTQDFRPIPTWDCLPAFATKETSNVSSTTEFDRSRRSVMNDFVLNTAGTPSVDADYPPVSQAQAHKDSATFGGAIDRIDRTADVDDVYFQLAHVDIMQWADNWHQGGLPELGFDDTSFEQLYNRG